MLPLGLRISATVAVTLVAVPLLVELRRVLDLVLCAVDDDLCGSRTGGRVDACPASRASSRATSLRLLEHAPRAGKLRPELRQRHVADALARLRGRDRGALRDHELDVAAALGEEQVARPQ